MDLGLEPSTLINSIVSALTLILAVSTFLILRMTARFRAVQERLREEDIPDEVRKSWWFNILTYLESALYLVALIYAVIVATYFLNLLAHVIGYYSNPLPSTNETLRQQQDYHIRLSIANTYLSLFSRDIGVLFVIVFSAAVVELLPALPLLPLTLVTMYLRTVKSQKIDKPSAVAMLEQAKASLQKADNLSAALLAGTAVEFFLRGLLDITAPTLWPAIMTSLRNKLTLEERFTKEEIVDMLKKLLNIRSFRNEAAHPSAGTRISHEEAQQVIDDTQDVITKLSNK